MNTTTSALAELTRMGSSGYARRMASADYRARVVAAGRLFAEAAAGDRYARLEFHDLMGGVKSAREALSTSDYPILFGDFLNRSLAQRYAVAQPVWRGFAARKLNRDFRASKVIDFFGASSVLDRVAELAEYPARAFDESEFETVLAKFGDRLQWSWEAMVNDDLGAFQDAPAALSRAAVATEDFVATSVLASATGPNAWLGTPATAKLSQDSLNTGIQTITNKTDGDGNPIVISGLVLVVPPALKLTAQNIINTTEIRNTSGNKQTIQTGNGLAEVPKIVVNPWLTSIDKSANSASTWYLVPDPSGPRPAVYETFLTGYEAPDLRVKADGGMRLGGGAVDPSEGSFERDDVQYRVRHVVGGNQGFDDAVFVSTGSA